MTRTYYIRHEAFTEAGYKIKFDKVTHRSPETRPRWHKVEALTAWKETHKGYGYLRINSVFTIAEMKQNGYL